MSRKKEKGTHSEDWSKERKIAKEWLLWVVAATVLLSGFPSVFLLRAHNWQRSFEVWYPDFPTIC